MRKTSRIKIVVGLTATMLCVVAVAAWTYDALYVQVAETRVRQAPSFLSPSLASLRYGDEVQKLAEKKGSWVEIQNAEVARGWVHKSALTAARLVLKPGQQSANIGAGRAEPTLAGKGFSRETEEDYKQKNQDLPFDALDRSAQLTPSDEEIVRFALEGKLNL